MGKKKSDNASVYGHATEKDGYVYHCFVNVKGKDIFIDVTSKQFDSQSDDIVFLSKREIDNAGWREYGDVYL